MLSSDQTSPYMTSSMLSRTSSSSSSAVGDDDYIGTESCFDVFSEENDAVSSSASESLSRYRHGGRRRREERRNEAAREFPPPIPLLAQTENLLPHMPWVLKRVVTSDGRLILREEKVRYHEYFRANRSNGRLTLQLVPLNDDVFELPQEPYYDNDDEHEVDDVDEGVTISASNDDDKGNVGDECIRKARLAAAAVEEEEEETVVESGVVGGGGGGSPRGKCMKSCFVGMRVQAIRTLL
ncbi:unnamed protein product [Cochlearia groenlandica]